MEIDNEPHKSDYSNYHDDMCGDFSETFTVSLSPLIEELDRQRFNNNFCDVELVAENKSYFAHKCVLAATTAYFKGMFEEDRFIESTGRKNKIELKSISSAALSTLLDLIYRGHFYLNTDIMYTVLAGADHLLYTEAKSLCADFMDHVLDHYTVSLTHAFRVRMAAQLYSVSWLQSKADVIISQSFSDMTHSFGFLELDCEQLLDLLSRDDIEEEDEKVFWQAGIDWIMHDSTERTKYFAQIAAKIRYPLMSATYLIETVSCHPLMSGQPDCQHFIADAIQYQLLPAQQTHRQTPQTKPRCHKHDMLIYCLVGGDEHFMCYSITGDHWYTLQTPQGLLRQLFTSPHDQYTYSLLTVSGHVFLGVYKGDDQEVAHPILQFLLCYKLKDNRWERKKLPTVQTHVRLIECQYTLYACSRQAIERYDFKDDSWDTMSTEPLKPCQFAVSESTKIYLYNLECGEAEVIYTNRNYEIRRHMVPQYAGADILNVAKLIDGQVCLSIRSALGIKRTIFNTKTNMWCDIHSGNMTSVMSSNLHNIGRTNRAFPIGLDPNDPWRIVCCRRMSYAGMYIIGTRSRLSDIPTTQPAVPSTSQSQHSSTACSVLEGTNDSPPPPKDGVLPLYTYRPHEHRWRRLAGIPECVVGGNITMCINDGFSSMATCTV